MNLPKKTLQWGIVGLGNIAHKFVQDLQLLKDTAIAAVASRKLTKAQDFAQRYNIPKAYGSYAEIFADATVDIIYIATPHNSHADLSIAAMNAGKHILCEKPLAVNQKQVQSVVDVAKQRQVFMMEAFWSRFNPSIQKALSLVKNGTIGDVNYLNVDFSVFRETPPENRMLNMNLAGGSLLEIGVYPCFLAYMIFGKPEQILAAGRFHETGADIQTSAIFKYKNGMANILSGFASQSDMIAKIYGTEGRIYIDSIWHETQGYTLIKDNNSASQTTKINLPTLGKGFTYEIRESIECIKNSQLESQYWSHQNSLDLISITDEIRRQIGLQYPFIF